jgi:hypothetical protein
VDKHTMGSESTQALACCWLCWWTQNTAAAARSNSQEQTHLPAARGPRQQLQLLPCPLHPSSSGGQSKQSNVISMPGVVLPVQMPQQAAADGCDLLLLSSAYPPRRPSGPETQTASALWIRCTRKGPAPALLQQTEEAARQKRGSLSQALLRVQRCV